MRKLTIALALILALAIPFGASASAPKQVTISSLYQSDYSQKTILKWNKVSGADGYQIERKKAGGSYKIIKTTTTRKYTSVNLSANTKYYYKVRAYKKVNGKKVYGDWSKAKSITIIGTKAYTIKAYSEFWFEHLWVGDRIKTDGRTGYDGTITIWVYCDCGAIIGSYTRTAGKCLYISKSNGFTTKGERLYCNGYPVGYIKAYSDLPVKSTIAVRREK